MENTLLIQDTLLYISIALISFGVGMLSVNFWQGIISMIVAAGIVIGRAILNREYMERKITDKIFAARVQEVHKKDD